MAELNKTQMLQFIGLFQNISEFTQTETPNADELDFLPIASDRHLHKDMVFALADDLSENLETPNESTVETPESATALN